MFLPSTIILIWKAFNKWNFISVHWIGTSKFTIHTSNSRVHKLSYFEHYFPRIIRHVLGFRWSSKREGRVLNKYCLWGHPTCTDLTIQGLSIWWQSTLNCAAKFANYILFYFITLQSNLWDSRTIFILFLRILQNWN